MALVSHTVTRTPRVSVERAFDVIVAEDVLPHVLHRWGPIPAVLGTRDLTGPWSTPGSARTVLLDDRSTVHEQVLQWRRPQRFEYRVDRFAAPLCHLADYALGAWTFHPTPHGSGFRWTYSFHARRGLVARLALSLFVHTAWARYMEQCADLCVRRAETPS
jgi:hypothetical protein